MGRGLKYVAGGLAATVLIVPAIESRTSHDPSKDNIIGQTAIGFSPEIVFELRSLYDADGAFRDPVAVDIRNFGSKPTILKDNEAATSSTKTDTKTESTTVDNVDISSPEFEKMVGVAILKSGRQFKGMPYGKQGHGDAQVWLKKWDQVGKKGTNGDCSMLASAAIEDVAKGSKTWNVNAMVHDKKNFELVNLVTAEPGVFAKRGTHHTEIYVDYDGNVITTFGAHQYGEPASQITSRTWDKQGLRFIGYRSFNDQQLKVFVQNVIALNQQQ